MTISQEGVLPYGIFYFWQAYNSRFMGADFSLLDDMYFLEHHLVNAADQSGAHILNVSTKEFDPHGVTILVLLSKATFLFTLIQKKTLQLSTVILAVRPLNRK